MVEFNIVNGFPDAHLEVSKGEPVEISPEGGESVRVDPVLQIRAISGNKAGNSRIGFATKFNDRDTIDFELTLKRDGETWTLRNFSQPGSEEMIERDTENPKVPVEIGPDGQ